MTNGSVQRALGWGVSIGPSLTFTPFFQTARIVCVLRMSCEGVFLQHNEVRLFPWPQACLVV